MVVKKLFIFLVLFIFSVNAFAITPRSTGKYKNWESFVAETDKGKICFAQTVPTKRAPAAQFQPLQPPPFGLLPNAPPRLPLRSIPTARTPRAPPTASAEPPRAPPRGPPPSSPLPRASPSPPRDPQARCSSTWRAGKRGTRRIISRSEKLSVPQNGSEAPLRKPCPPAERAQ